MSFLCKSNKKGFTLIELLVVVSIVSLLTSIVMVSLTSARARAQDTAKKVELNAIKSAVLAYKLDNNGRAPVPVGGGCNPTCDGQDFIDTMDVLVAGGYLSKLPSQTGLFYYAAPNEETGEDVVMVGARLITEHPTEETHPGTCLPFSSEEEVQATFESVQETHAPQDCRVFGYNGQIECRVCIDPGGCNSYQLTGDHTQCSNGIDDDDPGDGLPEDGLIDDADPGCYSPDDDRESPNPTPSGSGGTAYCAYDNPENADYCLCIF